MNKVGLIDMDGVISNTNTAIEKYIKENWGIDYKINLDNLRSYYLEDWGIGIDSVMTVQMFGNPDFYLTEEPIAGSAEAMRILTREGYKLHIVTARPVTEMMRKVTEDWLSEHSVPYYSLHIVDAMEKPAVAVEEGCSFFVEDSPKNILQIAAVTEIGFGIRSGFLNEVPNNVLKVVDLHEAAHVLTTHPEILEKYKGDK